ncbi:MAG: hypothetical protein Crog4KO_00400 [Crocinitomicaceae bacterium]
MDYNDIQLRLSRTFKSLEGRYDDDVDKYTEIKEWEDGKGMSFIFGQEDESDTLNKVMIILHNLASLKDHLKNTYKENSLSPSIIENEIDKSIHLQVLIDIVNQDKHGSPLRNPRSKKSPVIRDLSNGMRMADPRTGEMKPTMFIDGTVVDKNGKRICNLDELIENCFLKWKELSVKTEKK